MPPYTLGQAAKATGKQKSTIAEAINKGRLSATRDELGKYQIDPSELHRVYPLVSHQDDTADPPTEQHKTHDQTAKIILLEAKLQSMAELKDQIAAERDDLRRRQDSTDAERGKLVSTIENMTRMLTDQREKAQKTTQAPPRRKWFSWR